MGMPDDGTRDGSRAVRAVRQLLADLDFPVLTSVGVGADDIEHLADLALADFFITVAPAPWSRDEVVHALQSALALTSRT
jgi:alcohol dehydrogenase